MADITGLISISLFLKGLQKSECKILPNRWGELRDPFYTYLYSCVGSWSIRGPEIGPSMVGFNELSLYPSRSGATSL